MGLQSSELQARSNCAEPFTARGGVGPIFTISG